MGVHLSPPLSASTSPHQGSAGNEAAKTHLAHKATAVIVSSNTHIAIIVVAAMHLCLSLSFYATVAKFSLMGECWVL